MGESRKGKKHWNWRGGVSHSRYCPKFNEEIREYIRDKYGRFCIICGKDEEENGCKQSVYHVDYNKMQGCEEHEWRLVPLCTSCHIKSNFNRKEYERLLRKFIDMIEPDLSVYN